MVVIQSDAASTIDLESVSDATVEITYKDSQNDEEFTRPTRVGSLGTSLANIMQNSTVGKQMSNLSDFTQLRLVSGGHRLWKTSKQENESGVIQALYAPSGMSLDASLGEEIDRRNGSHHHIKVYPAALGGNYGGRAGFLLGGQFRPNDEGRYTRFS